LFRRVAPGQGTRRSQHRDSRRRSRRERRAEWLGNDNRKTTINVKIIGQILPIEKRHCFAQSISSAWLYAAVLLLQHLARLHLNTCAIWVSWSVRKKNDNIEKLETYA